MNIVIPLAGLGTRFAKEGYTAPKPLIFFRGKTMIEHAVESLGIQGRYIFITREFFEPYQSYLLHILKRYADKEDIIILKGSTRGSAETILAAKDKICSSEPLIQTNCDQILRWRPYDFLDYLYDSDVQGCVGTVSSNDPKHSYVKFDQNDNASYFVEKNPVSHSALIGLHYWKRGNFFVDAAERMIRENSTQQGEFYVSTSYNYMLQNFKDNGRECKITGYKIEDNEIRFLGTPEDLTKYLNDCPKN